MTLRFLDAQVLLAHCKADGDAREVEQYGESAEWAAESILNRSVYATEEEAAEARVAGKQAFIDARTDYDMARDTAGSDLDLAEYEYKQARIKAWRDINAIHADPELIGAMLMHAAHLFYNRTDVVTGQYGSAAVTVPMNSQWVYERKRLREGAMP